MSVRVFVCMFAAIVEVATVVNEVKAEIHWERAERWASLLRVRSRGRRRR